MRLEPFLLAFSAAASLASCRYGNHSEDTAIHDDSDSGDDTSAWFEASGPFEQVVTDKRETGGRYVCAREASGQAKCWVSYDVEFEDHCDETILPSNAAKLAISGGSYVCWLDDTGAASCSDLAGIQPPQTFNGKYSAISEGGLLRISMGGAIDTDFTFCGAAVPFAEDFVAAEPLGTASTPYGCGIHENGTMTCFGAYPESGCFVADETDCNCTDDEPALDLAGPYQSMSDEECFLRLDGTIECPWPLNSYDEAPPEGTFIEVSGAAHHAAVKTDGAIVYWDTAFADPAAFDTPIGSYLHVSQGRDITCAITAERNLRCWGADVKALHECGE